MSLYQEQIIHEFPKFLRKKTHTKDVYIALSVMKRIIPGREKPGALLDIREYVESVRGCGWQPSGIKFRLKDLDILMEQIKEAKSLLTKLEEEANAADNGNRNQNLSCNQKESELL